MRVCAQPGRHLLAKGDCELCVSFLCLCHCSDYRGQTREVWGGGDVIIGHAGGRARPPRPCHHWMSKASEFALFPSLALSLFLSPSRAGGSACGLQTDGVRSRNEAPWQWVLVSSWNWYSAATVTFAEVPSCFLQEGWERDRERKKIKKQFLMKTFIEVSSFLRTGCEDIEVIKEMREEDGERCSRQHDNTIKIKEAQMLAHLSTFTSRTFYCCCCSSSLSSIKSLICDVAQGLVGSRLTDLMLCTASLTQHIYLNNLKASDWRNLWPSFSHSLLPPSRLREIRAEEFTSLRSPVKNALIFNYKLYDQHNNLTEKK